MRQTRALSRRTLLHTTLLGVAGVGVGACSTRAAKHQRVVRYQGWADEVVYLELAADLGLLGDVRLEWIGNTTSGPQDIQATVTGDTDIGAAFNGAIIRLVAAGAPIRAVVGYYGADAQTLAGYYTLEDSPLRSARDLVNKKVGVNTLGAHHEDVLTIALERAGLSEEAINSVQLVVVPPVSAEQALRSGQLDVAVLSDVKREKALAHGGIRPLFTDFSLLGPFTAGCYVMREEFLASQPETARTVVDGIARAVRWTQTQPRAEVIGQMTDIIRRRGRNEDTTTVEYWRSPGVARPGGLIADSDFETWRMRLTKDGHVPPSLSTDQLYTNRFNPFRRV